MTIRYISMFSGIECASLAVRAGGLNWDPVCFAEIEKFPASVLAHHYPDVPNVGDITVHDWWQYRGKVDVVIGGSPCQAFSVAGRRDSLGDARGNLTLSFVEAVDAIDPELVVWENVPGVLSVKDNAFGWFLTALAGCSAPVIPPSGQKWSGAGVVAGPKRLIAWRTLNAQYFGVPQRRRRVYLVAGRVGGWANPAEILFKPESLCRNSPAGKETEEEFAAVS